MKIVWVTRAQPGADATAARVRALGLEPLVEPLLETRALGEGPPDLAGVGALAFTSANAARAFARRSPERALRVFAVGAATAQAAREAGFGDVRSADGDVAALARQILAERDEIAGVLLHASAAEPAGDLTGSLARGGMPARRLVLYETIARAPGPSVLALAPPLRFVLVHSPRAAARLADVLKGGSASDLTVLCLSPAVAAPLARASIGSAKVAEEPNEDALMALLAREAAN